MADVAAMIGAMRVRQRVRTGASKTVSGHAQVAALFAVWATQGTPVRHEDLMEISGCSGPTLTRAIGILEHDGLIAVERKELDPSGRGSGSSRYMRVWRVITNDRER